MTATSITMASPVELVIFDCDGVLVDSERITNRVFAEMAAEYGLQLTPAYMDENFFGLPASECVRLAGELLGHALPADFAGRYGERSRAALAQEVTTMPGVPQMLDSIDLPSAIASNGIAIKMRITLGKTGLLSRYEGRWFCVDDVKHGKPAPDLYLLAARTFGADPAACVVIEDSPTGVAAGVAAGMTVLGYAAHTPAQRLIDAGAQLTFADMAQLPGLLRLVPSLPQTAH
jgi:HAD superfamily hydrolase (TIGR01509 family)